MTTPKDNIIIRDARPEELPAILDLTRDAYAEFGMSMPAVNWQGLSHTIVKTLQDPGAAEIIVAEAGDELVGSVLLFPADKEAYGNGAGRAAWPVLRLLAVPPKARGRGIGKALMEECIRRAREAGATTLLLHTSASMGVALPMYERRGFVRYPALDFAVPDGEDVHAYHLHLAGE